MAEDRPFWGWGYRTGHGWGWHGGAGRPEGFSGFVAAFGRRPGRFFESGQVRLAILSLLADGPKHGYEIIKALEARSGGLYRASAGTVYPTLQLLEDEGLAECTQEDGRKVYRITADGRRELKGEADAVKHIWDRAANWEDWSKWRGPEAAMVMGPLGALVKAAFKATARAASRNTSPDRVREILDAATKDLDSL
jgi:DNA-binding PadR family transcriptional regulator